MVRVILAGTFDPAFARNRRLRAMLERADYEIATCQVDLWGGDRYEIVKKRKRQVLARALFTYPRLVVRFLAMPRADVVLVGYPGWFDMIVLRPVARLRRMPIVFDTFISLYDTLVSDRKLASPHSLLGRLCKLVDRWSLRAARRVLADTPSQAAFYADLGHIPPLRVGVVRIGADDDLFRPRPHVAVWPRRVLFYGSFIRLHGIETILHAAKRLEGDGIEFRIIGGGQEQPMVDHLMGQLRPTNVDLVTRVPVELLPDEIAAATVCLGIFGTSAKARRVVPHKVFECAAVGRPIVTGDTEAMREAFADGEIAMVPPGNPEALSREIRRLIADTDTRERLAAAGHARYLELYATDCLTRVLDDELRSVLARGPHPAD